MNRIINFILGQRIFMVSTPPNYGTAPQKLFENEMVLWRLRSFTSPLERMGEVSREGAFGNLLI